MTQTNLQCLLEKLVNPFERTLAVSVKLDVLIIGIGEGDQTANQN